MSGQEFILKLEREYGWHISYSEVRDFIDQLQGRELVCMATLPSGDPT